MARRRNDIAGVEAAFRQLADEFPRMQKEFTAAAGDRMLEKARENISARTSKHTGNLLAGAYLHLGSGGGYAAVRNDHMTAPHAHLIEFGHEVKSKSGKTIGWADGRYMYRDALREVEDEMMAKAKQLSEEVARLVE